jgi:PAS domain S-box-containing protein
MEHKISFEELVEQLPPLNLAELRCWGRRPVVLRGSVQRASAPYGRTQSHETLNAPETEAEQAISRLFAIPDAMLFVVDLVEGRFLQVNHKVSSVLGYSRAELLQSSFLDRVHPDDHPKTMQEMERLVAGERSAGFRNRHLDANGTYKTFEWTAVSDEDGELCYAMAIDVTED